MIPIALLVLWLAGSVSCLTGRPNVHVLLEEAALGVRQADQRCADRALAARDLERAERCARAYADARDALVEAEEHADDPGVWCRAKRAAERALDLVSEAGAEEGRASALALHRAAGERCP